MAHFNTLVTEADSLISSMRQHIPEHYDYDSSSSSSSSSTSGSSSSSTSSSNNSGTDTAEERNDESKDV